MRRRHKTNKQKNKQKQNKIKKATKMTFNDLSDDLSTNAKSFADDASLFSEVRDINTSAAHLNNDLRRISNWAFQWKMSFNPDTSKQAQEVIFSDKLQKISHPSVYFNNN